jgi:uncharacterized membrane-anchored protein
LAISGATFREEIVTSIAIPVVALTVALGVRRFRRRTAEND